MMNTDNRLSRKTIRLVAVDLDGTLLNENKLISVRNRRTLQNLLKMGIRIVISTGRNVTDAKLLVSQIANGLPQILYNGAVILKNNELLRQTPINNQHVKQIIRFMRENNYHPILYTAKDKRYTENCQVLPAMVKMFIQENPEAVEEISHLEDIYDESILRISVWEKPQITAQLQEEFKICFGDMFTFYNFHWKFWIFEILNRNSTKANALRYLCDIWNIKPSEIVAIGDDLNDIGMIRFAGTGVAMANAREPVKMAADLVTLSNQNDGVSHILEWLIPLT